MEEVFVRQGVVFHLHVGGQVIRTTPEHPYWVQDQGWTAAGELKIGDLISTEAAGGWVAVEDLLDTGQVETVYNFRVADYHTYFVGSTHWGFSVWVHNTYQVNGRAVTSELLHADPHGFVSRRVQRFQNLISDQQKGRITMGVAVVEDSKGLRRSLIATSEPDGYLRPGVTLRPGETLVPGLKHAEQDLADYIAANRLKLISIGATRPVCDECVSAILSTRASLSEIVTPLKHPSNWL